MTILEAIENKLQSSSNEKSQELWLSVKKIIPDIVNHNKLIVSQMPLYDIHDEEHSKKILEIEEQLLGEKVNDLSFSELLLLYLSAYLHDSAMALPHWEYKALKATEGTDECHDNSIKFALRNDFKAVQKTCDIRKFVYLNKNDLFEYEIAKKFIFSAETEEEMIDDISLLVSEYEQFRSGFNDQLKKRIGCVEDFIDYSEKIRFEFIRQTHHKRVTKYILRLKRFFKESIGELEANSLCEILASICRAHGEDIRFVKSLSSETQDFNGEKCNAQFVAMMLRLGDVIHFNNERAPVSLFAEKHIDDPTSEMHWISKEQDLNYNVVTEGENITIKFVAYCKKPEIYYFINDYLDWIDHELSNYYQLKNYWQSERVEKYKNYDLPLTMFVNRERLEYDSKIFKPDRSMKFVLNQSKILELLTGVQLYKDKYLCLRELYQNALDASKCMRAYNSTQGITQQLPVIFGLGKEMIEGKEQSYIYCLDHGTGMNEYIIKNYLLKIGTSYYKSSDFLKQNTGWNFDVVPTSQFGIGILSGYMLADKIGVTTVYYQNNSNPVSFVIGNSEQFYYNNPKKVDLEKIGKHGTLVKLYLKSQYSEIINNANMLKLPLLIMNGNRRLWKDYYSEDEVCNNLQFILFNNIGIVEKDIPVMVENENEHLSPVLSSVEIFDHRNYPEITKEEVVSLWSQHRYLDGSFNPFKEVVEYRDFIQDYAIELKTSNIVMYSHIALPKKGAKFSSVKLYDYCHFLGNHEGSVYVDGVYVDKMERFSDDSQNLGRDIKDKSIFNFVGVKRPVLSVDRNSIIEYPELSEEFLDLRKQFISKLCEVMKQHIVNEDLQSEDNQISLIFDIVIRAYPSIANELIKELQSYDIDLNLFVDGGLETTGVKVVDLFRSSDICLESVDFRRYKEITRQLIIGRLLSSDKIEIENNSLHVNGDSILAEIPFIKSDFHSHYDNLSMYSFVIKTDKWSGLYEEYDMVNSLWPLVSPNLYNALHDYDTQESFDRIKTIADYGNSIAGMANLDPVMIDPEIGISSKQQDVFSRNKCYVGVIENIQNQYFLFEFTEHGKIYFEDKESYVLYAFYEPRELNEAENKRSIELENEKIEYIKGLKEGFSVLYIGGNKPHYIVKAGRIPKQEILKSVPNSFWEEGITYYDFRRNIIHAAD